MNIRSFFRSGFLIALCLAALANAGSSARADATDLLAAASTGGSVDIKMMVHGQDERDDLSITSPIQVGITVIKQYDLSQYVVLDSKLKAYTSVPISQAPLDLSGIPNIISFFQPFTPAAHPQTRSETIAYTVVDEGDSPAPGLVGVTGRHYSISVVDTHLMASSSADTSSPVRQIHSDLWVDTRYKRPISAQAVAGQRVVTLPGGDKVSYVFSGDLAAYDEAMSYLPLEVFGNGPGQSAALKQTAPISGAAVDAALFSVPAGYKQMSLDDFATAEQNALLDMISGPQPKLPNAAK